MSDSRITPGDIEYCKKVLVESGYVVLKEKSYRAAQERQRIAEVIAERAGHDRDSAVRWAYNCLAEERHMRDRVTFVYGVARAPWRDRRGAT